MLRHLLPETIQMLTKLDPELGSIKVDPGQMHQVLLNLALNARDAMPEGGCLTMETANVRFDEAFCAAHPEAMPGPCVLLAVTDSGTGIDEAVRGHLFEPFFTTKAPGRGTGLGLASVYGIIRQSGGWISVESKVREGTVFKIFFPRIETPVPGDDAATGNARTSRGTETNGGPDRGA